MGVRSLRVSDRTVKDQTIGATRADDKPVFCAAISIAAAVGYHQLGWSSASGMSNCELNGQVLGTTHL
jgi:hypothetical protein